MIGGLDKGQLSKLSLFVKHVILEQNAKIVDACSGRTKQSCPYPLADKKSSCVPLGTAKRYSSKGCDVSSSTGPACYLPFFIVLSVYASLTACRASSGVV